MVQERFNASLAESGVQLTALPPAQLNALINALADSIFAVMEGLEDEAADASPIPPRRFVGDPQDAPIGQTGAARPEEILWRGRPFLTIGTRYELTTERLRIYRGIFGNRIEEIELVRIKDTRVKQHMGERMLDVGDITVISADAATPDIVLNNVRDPVDVRELIRHAVMEEKNRRGLYYREDISGD
jgi:hypothetical protein